MSAQASTYLSELQAAMRALADDERTIFVGQGLRYNCHRMWQTLADVPMEKRVEFPVAEEMQLGYCTGLALEGYIPICIYPRIDFMLRAMDQLVNHLDKAHLFGWSPKVIIRTAIGSTSPLNPGPQHSQDHKSGFRWMLKHVQTYSILNVHDVARQYADAMKDERPSIIIEEMSCY